MKRTAFIAAIAMTAAMLGACSISSQQLGPNDYELSGYFDFTLKGEVVAKGLEDQARSYCRNIGSNLVPDVYYVTDVNREFNYSAQRAAATIKFRCVPQQ